jgi:multiple sugar transport system permease protein
MRPPAWLAAPLLAWLALFLVQPCLWAVRLALTDSATGRFPSSEGFASLGSDPLFWRALAGNLVIPAASVALELLAGLGLALVLAARLPARRLLGTLVIVPFALPEIVFLTIVHHVLVPRGYANAALVALGAGPVDFLQPGHWAAYASVIVADAWRTTPVVFLVLVAGLAAIPQEIHDAARLDGARGLRRLFHVTLPLLRPALLAALLLRGLDALRIFATPLVLTGVEGVPVLSTYAYHQWADQGADAVAAAAACVLALLCVALSAPLLRRRASGAA